MRSSSFQTWERMTVDGGAAGAKYAGSWAVSRAGKVEQMPPKRALIASGSSLELVFSYRCKERRLILTGIPTICLMTENHDRGSVVLILESLFFVKLSLAWQIDLLTESRSRFHKVLFPFLKARCLLRMRRRILFDIHGLSLLRRLLP